MPQFSEEGIRENEKLTEDEIKEIDEMLDNTDLLIGPIPYTKDKKYINLFCEDKISISELLLKTRRYFPYIPVDSLTL